MFPNWLSVEFKIDFVNFVNNLIHAFGIQKKQKNKKKIHENRNTWR